MTTDAVTQTLSIPDLSLRRLMADDPVMTTTGLIMLALLPPMAIAAGLDVRVLDGENIWLKPMKFAVSIAAFVLTLAAFARHLPRGLRAQGLFRWGIVVFALAAVLEMLWIGGAATLGVRSHFNESSDVAATLYGVMGLVAVVLTSASLVYGVAIWRNADARLRPAMRWAIGLGLVLTFVLTVITAGTLGGRGALIGEVVTGAAVPVLGWSLEVGDLRVAHFLSTHILQILPLLIWITGWISIRNVILTAGAITTLTLATYVQALAGLPLLALG